MAIRAIIEAIEARLEALGFTPTEEVFDFDTAPTSIINKAFRVETKTADNRYYSGKVANPREEITVWITYKTGRRPREAWKVSLDDTEAIERDLVNASSISSLQSDPILTMDRDASSTKLLEGVLVMRLVFTADYLRDVSPS